MGLIYQTVHQSGDFLSSDWQVITNNALNIRPLPKTNPEESIGIVREPVLHNNRLAVQWAEGSGLAVPVALRNSNGSWEKLGDGTFGINPETQFIYSTGLYSFNDQLFTMVVVRPRVTGNTTQCSPAIYKWNEELNSWQITQPGSLFYPIASNGDNDFSLRSIETIPRAQNFFVRDGDLHITYVEIGWESFLWPTTYRRVVVLRWNGSSWVRISTRNYTTDLRTRGTIQVDNRLWLHNFDNRNYFGYFDFDTGRTTGVGTSNWTFLHAVEGEQVSTTSATLGWEDTPRSFKLVKKNGVAYMALQRYEQLSYLPSTYDFTDQLNNYRFAELQLTSNRAKDPMLVFQKPPGFVGTNTTLSDYLAEDNGDYLFLKGELFGEVGAWLFRNEGDGWINLGGSAGTDIYYLWITKLGAAIYAFDGDKILRIKA